MRKLYFFLGALLLVDGVFGEENVVSVFEGESITLNPHTVSKEDASVEWFFGDSRIAKRNKAAGTSYPDERFRGRLKLDHQTGSLTITNTRTNYTGLYKLQIRSSSTEKIKIFNVTIRSAVFGDDVTVSVMEGDSVTLNPQTVIPEDDSAQWWFGGKIIAQMKKATAHFSTSEGDDVGFNGGLKLDHQTGSLNITNIKTTDSGLYKLQIRGRTETFKIFIVTVRSDAVTTVSVIEGDTVLLHTGVTDIQRDDQIQWKFEDQVLNGADARWSNIVLNDKTGDLTIRNIGRKQYGDYKVEVHTSSLILHRKFHINTLAIDHSKWMWIGIVIGIVIGFVIGIVIGTKFCPCRKKTLDPVPSGDMDLLESNLNKESDTRNTH